MWRGAIFFTSKYGSTTQHANWIAEAINLTVFDINKTKINLSKYDFLVLGSPIIYYKLLNRKWIKANSTIIEKKQLYYSPFLEHLLERNLINGLSIATCQKN